MVQDLQAVNNAVIQRAPCVPDPHTLLNSLTPDTKIFTVIDISNAFFSVPIAKESQFWFAFTYAGSRYTFSRLPQGYCESPTIYSQVMAASMAKFVPPMGSQILLYVDDILIASPDFASCQKDTLAVLHHLASEGHKVSKNKLQLWSAEIKYLGHNLSSQGRSIIESRKASILQAPKPLTKKQMMSFLGLTGYCRNWILDYAQIVAPLSKLMYVEDISMSAHLKWTPEAEDAFVLIKQALVSSSTLALPNYDKVFVQTVDCKGHYMTSVLLQSHGSKLRPIAFYSSKLDSVACALPPCVRAVVAASMAVESSAGVVLFHPLTLKVPHAVSALLLQTNMTFLSPARHLSCMATLLSQPHLTVERCTTLNPATLIPLPDDGEFHDCVDAAQQIAKARPDLEDTPLPDGHVVFVDGSSKKNESGVTLTGYAIVTADVVLEAAKLPSNMSAQAAELIALTGACKLFANKSVTIWTDSQYAFATVHVFAQQWSNRGMITSTGKPVSHSAILTQLLDAVQLPLKVAVCKCAAHTAGSDPVSLGNAFADKSAKAAAEGLLHVLSSLTAHDSMSHISPDVLLDMQSQSPSQERLSWEKRGATKNTDGLFV
ncbi:uncharacterized protein LOC133147271 [Syngnathus typhle]|uniref:uncharacterized protein LOC133147271 n=1 Tax=Syngnathus typhle TaxID=161592 RepID=UPI002A6A2277|nr:uncharacterized protein LOC133147271 [Syngnathus typhle]